MCDANCQLCDMDKCAKCTSGYVLNITEDGSRSCLEMCPSGFYADAHMICRPCHADCMECNGEGNDRCLSCSDPAKKFLSTKKLRTKRHNLRAMYEYQMRMYEYKMYEEMMYYDMMDENMTEEYSGEYSEQYLEEHSEELDMIEEYMMDYNMTLDEIMDMNGYSLNTEYYNVSDYIMYEGMCVDTCELYGFALYETTEGMCDVCEPYGCTACDSSGQCTECSKEMGYSLLTKTDENGTEMTYCHQCNVTGCMACADNDVNTCIMCMPMYALDTTDSNITYCTEFCPLGYFKSMMNITDTMVSGYMMDLTHEVCEMCESPCSECGMNNSTFCLKCLPGADGSIMYSNYMGECVDTCDAGYLPVSGRCRKCGMGVTTCEYTDDMDMMVTGCEAGYYIDPYYSRCVDKCPEEYFANMTSGMCEKCQDPCKHCVQNANDQTMTDCTKCMDATMIVDADGTCKSDISMVTCPAGTYKDELLPGCVMCNYACDMTAGGIGKTSRHCLACAEGHYINATYTTDGTTHYKCVKSCGKFAEITMDNGMMKCNPCYTNSTHMIYDEMSMTCVANQTDCPAGTAYTYASYMMMADTSAADTVRMNMTDIKVCAKCDPRCETCLMHDTSICTSCSAGFYSTETMVDMWDYNTNTTTSMMATNCTKKCTHGMYAPSGSMMCNETCMEYCAICNNATSCERCMPGTYIDNSSGSDMCVMAESCPMGTFASNATGMCEPCTSPCENCMMKSNWCTSCEAGSMLFPDAGLCVESCPIGTYMNNSQCMPCMSGILNCDQSTGMESTTGMTIPCDPSCGTCFWSKAYCLSCAPGKMMAPHGRCVSECPADTTLEMMNEMPYCKSCSQGCLKCMKANDYCEADGTFSMDNQTMRMEPICIRCDTDLGYYLFRGKCVKEDKVPQGTFADKITGWVSLCDCNCGSGGCTSKNTCKECPADGMVIDPDSGRCKCDTTVSADFSDDWKTIKITIDTTNGALRFRDLYAEMTYEHMYYNMHKICRIGNEGSVFDEDYHDYFKLEDVNWMRCGDMNYTDMELEYIKYKFFENDFDYYTMKDDYKGDFKYTDPSTSDVTESYKNDSKKHSTDFGINHMSNSTYDRRRSLNKRSRNLNESSEDMDYMNMSFEDYMSYKNMMVDDYDYMCPAKYDKYTLDDLDLLGMVPENLDFYKYIAEKGYIFGNIPDWAITDYTSPTYGLEFTSSPDDLCYLLFDWMTLHGYLGDPTCHLEVMGNETVITIETGVGAYIHKDFYLKVQPNVFIEGCDWPILDILRVNDGAQPMSLELNFDGRSQEAPVCRRFDFSIESEGNVGMTDCWVGVNAAYDESGMKIETDEMKMLINKINKGEDEYYMYENMTEEEYYDMYKFESSYDVSVEPSELQQFKDKMAKHVEVLAYCWDGVGQEQIIYDNITIVDNSYEIHASKEIYEIEYDESLKNNKIYDLGFSNVRCDDMSSGDIMTSAMLQEMMNGQWMNVSEIQDRKLPDDLDCSKEYRVQYKAYHPNDSMIEDVTEEIPITCIRKQPMLKSENIMTQFLASETFMHMFTTDDFKNVDDIYDGQFMMSFDCSSCSDYMEGGPCIGADNMTEIDINQYYSRDNKTLMIPGGTLMEGECYELTVFMVYKGEEGESMVYMFIAEPGITSIIPIEFNIENGEYLDPYEEQILFCEPYLDFYDNETDYMLTDFMLVDGYGLDLLMSDCVYSNEYTGEVYFEPECIPEDSDITYGCEFTNMYDESVFGWDVRTFTTSAGLSFTPDITPTSGTNMTKFVVSVTNNYDKSIKCNLGYMDTTDYKGFIKKGSGSLQVPALSTASFSRTRFPVDAYYSTTRVMIKCKDSEMDTFSTEIIDVSITPYSGSDLESLRMSNVNEMVEGLETISDEEFIDEIIEDPEALGYLDSGNASQVYDKVMGLTELLFEVEGITEDTVDLAVQLFEAVVSVVAQTGISEDEMEEFMERSIDAMFGLSYDEDLPSYEDDSELDAESVKSIRRNEGEDKVFKHSITTIKKSLENMDEFIQSVENNKGNITQLGYEKLKRQFYDFADKIAKSASASLRVNEELNVPYENFYIFAKKLNMSQSARDDVIQIDYECPCSANYKKTASATSNDVVSGAIKLNETTTANVTMMTSGASSGSNGETHSAQGGKLERKTAEGQCYVKLPPLSGVSSYVQGCKSVTVFAVTTKKMCANSEVSSEDSAAFQESSASSGIAQLTEISSNTTTTTYNTSSLGSSADLCDTSEYSDMKCTGGNIEISYYCADNTTVNDTTKQIGVRRLEITQIDNGYVEYSMNCPAASDTYSEQQTESPTFLDESTGSNSCNGCANTTDGTVRCVHFTSFGYSKSTFSSSPMTSSSSSSEEEWEERLYEDFVLYIILLLDIYFIITLVFHLMMKDKRSNSMRVMDQSIAIHEQLPRPIDEKNKEVEVASAYDKNSNNSKGEVEGLHKKSFFSRVCQGIKLKYRLLTPFTTAHEKYSRVVRGAINVLVLYAMWVFSGIILRGVDNTAGAYILALVISFIIARTFTFALEFLLKNRSGKAMMILGALVAVCLAVLFHLGVIMLTKKMDKEFDDWGLLLFLVWFVDLVPWEFSSLFVQLHIAKNLASNPDAYSGKRKAMESFVTQPLLKAHIDP